MLTDEQRRVLEVAAEGGFFNSVIGTYKVAFSFLGGLAELTSALLGVEVPPEAFRVVDDKGRRALGELAYLVPIVNEARRHMLCGHRRRESQHVELRLQPPEGIDARY